MKFDFKLRIQNIGKGIKVIMEQYWISMIIQDTENSKPWLSASTESNVSLESALETIQRARKNYRVLSAWVDVCNEKDEKTTVFHKCYINILGYLEKIEE